MYSTRIAAAAVLILSIAAVVFLFVRQYWAAALCLSVAVLPFIHFYREVGEWAVLGYIGRKGGTISTTELAQEFPRNGLSIMNRLVKKGIVSDSSGVFSLQDRK